MRLNRLINGDGEVVGYFSDHIAEMAARREWDKAHDKSHDYATQTARCRSVVTDVVTAELEGIDVGDGERIDCHLGSQDVAVHDEYVGIRVAEWLRRGAADVVVSRYLVNKYRRPGGRLRDADLGGPAQAAGVLYVLRVRAPQ